MSRELYVGTMNDALFLIDQPPRPAPIDYAFPERHQDLNVIAKMTGNDCEAQALAHQFVAAPALLEFAQSMQVALELAAVLHPESAVHFRQFARDAAAVIAKAEGK